MGDFEAFCLQAHPRLVAAFTHQFGDVWLAEELAQEALIRAGLRWGHVRGLQAPEGWAFRVGCNLGISVMRHRAVEGRAARRRAMHAESHLDPDTPDVLAVRGALQQIPDAMRRAVIAMYYLDLTAEQTAESMGTTAGNVRVLRHRGLERLRGLLGIPIDGAINV